MAVPALGPDALALARLVVASAVLAAAVRPVRLPRRGLIGPSRLDSRPPSAVRPEGVARGAVRDGSCVQFGPSAVRIRLRRRTRLGRIRTQAYSRVVTHLVVAVAYPGMGAFEFGVCVEVFALPRPELDVDWYDFALCVPDGPVSGVGGFTLGSPHGLDVLNEADTVVAIGWPTDTAPSEELLAALQAAHRRGARMVSFCSGVFLFAAAGLLDGRKATTHWMYAEKLRARHPSLRVDPGVLYIDEGDVLTSAGTAAAIDLCLHVVRGDHGTEVANSVARRMVVAPHREGGQAQFVRAPVPRDTTADSVIYRLLEWMQENLDQPMSFELLAARAYMSPRTFSRRFRDATGTSPAKWLLHQRLDRSRELLERTDETLDRISTAVGFGSAVTLRHHFASVLNTSPTGYRRAFRGAPSSVPEPLPTAV